jgi:hypothetical protein
MKTSPGQAEVSAAKSPGVTDGPSVYSFRVSGGLDDAGPTFNVDASSRPAGRAHRLVTYTSPGCDPPCLQCELQVAPVQPENR